jgi:2-methylisocitrate lyase-like PEP mutase family enzyme
MRVMSAQKQKAELFRRLHHGPEILVLPNAWDCASARIFEEAGFPAIATTSAGVAFSLGYPDGEFIPQDEMLAAVKRIASRVRVPVTADLESGYRDIAKTTAALIDSGAVGLNIEDMEHAESKVLTETGRQVEKIARCAAWPTAWA